ncbi:zinc finger matrin-type protein 3-like [Cebidichthys violaceus]|uniref:zinc finger matrin-type protein 3-like n=1 Tax=Cebidichthys violaceus TaxID=271503 RepID=UPI0035CC0096
MKCPKSPDWPDGSRPPKSREGQEEDMEEEDEEEEERKVAAVHRAKRERRQGGGGGGGSATVCRVCNIQLNSNAQAQIHYRGKTHQRRLRRLAKAVSTDLP